MMPRVSAFKSRRNSVPAPSRALTINDQCIKRKRRKKKVEWNVAMHQTSAANSCDKSQMSLQSGTELRHLDNIISARWPEGFSCRSRFILSRDYTKPTQTKTPPNGVTDRFRTRVPHFKLLNIPIPSAGFRLSLLFWDILWKGSSINHVTHF